MNNRKSKLRVTIRRGLMLATAVLSMVSCTVPWISAAEPPVVRYEDFGAKGDGKTDDHPAIIRAHEYANQHGLPVRAKDGATYYFGGMSNSTAVIQTDTDFGAAKFIIDDTQVDDRKKNVFEVRSPLEPIKIEKISSLKQNQNRIDVTLPQPCLVMASNEKVKHFIRRGANQMKRSSTSFGAARTITTVCRSRICFLSMRMATLIPLRRLSGTLTRSPRSRRIRLIRHR